MPEITSEATHERHKVLIDQMRLDLAQHQQQDREFHEYVRHTMDRLLAYKNQTRAIVAMVALLAAAGLAGAQWMISHSVQDALRDLGVIKIEVRK